MLHQLKFWSSIIVALLVVVSVRAQADPLAEALESLQSSDASVRRAAVGTLTQRFKDEFVEPLTSALEDSDGEVRAAAAMALGHHKVRRAVPALAPLLKDKNDAARAAAPWALWNIGDADAVPLLVEALRKPGPGDEFRLIEALAHFDDPRAVMPLWELRNTDYRDRAIAALGKSAQEAMCAILTDRKASLQDRFLAVGVLAGVADERASDVLFSVIEDWSLGRVAAQAIGSRIGESATDRLLVLATSAEPAVRTNAVIGLTYVGNYQPPQAEATMNIQVDVISVPEFEFTYRPDRFSTGEESAEVIQTEPKDPRIVPAILAAMKDKSEHVRRVAVKSLSSVDREDVRNAMVAALKDPVMQVEASLSLGRKKDPRAVPTLLKLLTDQVGYSYMMQPLLARIGSPAVDGLIAILTDKNKDYPLREKRAREDRLNTISLCGNEPPPLNQDPRTWAAGLLAAIGDERARLPLTLALKDKTEWLPIAAASALKQLDKKKTQ